MIGAYTMNDKDFYIINTKEINNGVRAKKKYACLSKKQG
jgi:hypothetical protein